MTYNGDGQLMKTDYSYPGSVCPNVVRGAALRKHLVVHKVRRDTSRCSWVDELTWNTALGGCKFRFKSEPGSGIKVSHPMP